MLEMRYVAGAPKNGRESFVFQADNNRINKGDIRDYTWSYDEQYDKVRRFYKELSTRSIRIFFFQRLAGEENELYTKPEEMYEIFDRDVQTQKMGKLWVGDYFINCYIISSSKQEYDNGVVISTTLTVLSDFRWWKVISTILGQEQGEEPTDVLGLDYQHDFKYDYTGFYEKAFKRMQSEAITAFDFRLEFQGYIDNPTFIVGDNVYRVLTTVLSDETLIIDSLERRVYKENKNSHDQTNVFNDRDRGTDAQPYNIFAKMPSDENVNVVWPEGHAVKLTAYIERSEPTWI